MGQNNTRENTVHPPTKRRSIETKQPAPKMDTKPTSKPTHPLIEKIQGHDSSNNSSIVKRRGKTAKEILTRGPMLKGTPSQRQQSSVQAHTRENEPEITAKVGEQPPESPNNNHIHQNGHPTAHPNTKHKIQKVVIPSHNIAWSELAVGEAIAEGGEGKIYKALYNGQEVVIKIGPDVWDEEAVLRSLSHPNVVKCLGYSISRNNEKALILEFCSGGDFGHFLKAHPEIMKDQALIRRYVDQMLISLEYLHDIGWVHADIKEANYFVATDGLLRLGDFGYCQTEKRAFLCGTPGYLSPEILEDLMADDGVTYGCESDLFALGVTLVKILLRKYPFSMTEQKTYWRQEVDFTEEMLDKHYTVTPELRKELLAFDPLLGPMIIECLTYNPDERISATECRSRLRKGMVKDGQDPDAPLPLPKDFAKTQ